MWGGTGNSSNFNPTEYISIHPPLVGWDYQILTLLRLSKNFNPPTPCGVGQVAGESTTSSTDFNPPTPCGVGRASFQSGQGRRSNFNPPTPCGVGHVWQVLSLSTFKFQSTHPLWGGTTRRRWLGCCEIFQSTHPLWGGTSEVTHTAKRSPNFNPPTPCGVGHFHLKIIVDMIQFQSTHPLWGGTQIIFYLSIPF